MLNGPATVWEWVWGWEGVREWIADGAKIKNIKKWKEPTGIASASLVPFVSIAVGWPQRNWNCA